MRKTIRRFLRSFMGGAPHDGGTDLKFCMLAAASDGGEPVEIL